MPRYKMQPVNALEKEMTETYTAFDEMTRYRIFGSLMFIALDVSPKKYAVINLEEVKQYTLDEIVQLKIVHTAGRARKLVEQKNQRMAEIKKLVEAQTKSRRT